MECCWSKDCPILLCKNTNNLKSITYNWNSSSLQEYATLPFHKYKFIFFVSALTKKWNLND